MIKLPRSTDAPPHKLDEEFDRAMEKIEDEIEKLKVFNKKLLMKVFDEKFDEEVVGKL